MNCEFGGKMLDDYFDHQLDAASQAALLAHCRRCQQCRALVDQHTQYLLRLKQFKLSLSQMEKPFEQPASVGATGLPIRQKRVLRDSRKLLLRTAAAVATFATAVSLYYTSGNETNIDIAQANGDIWSKVNIVIQVPTEFHDARLTISLPQGIYVHGYENTRTLAWNADFAQGTNAFELPVRIDEAAFDRRVPQYLDATLEYQGASKTFEFPVGLDEMKTL